MSELEYQEAVKLGKKEYKNCVTQGRFPYLPVLDEILSHAEIRTEQYMGLQQVPLEFVVGTSTVGRTYSFAANFMPILPPKSEFGLKWAHLADAQVNEGIRDPIVAYEFMNRYYVVEGNKRVSVLKYYNAVSIPAIVTRKIPVYNENDEDIKRYYELMKFHEATGMISMEFTKHGKAQMLLDQVGAETPWDEKTREDFVKVVFSFTRAYEFHGGKKLPITVGDALVAFLNVYGYDNALKMTEGEYSKNIQKSWNEFVVLTQKKQVGLVMDPEKNTEKKTEKKTENLLNIPLNKMPLLGYFLPASTKKLKAAFLYPKSPDDSDWIYAHELGRNYLQETFSDQLTTVAVDNVNEENIEEVLQNVIDDGASIVFGVAPQMMNGSLKKAIEHPEVKILNCSLNTPHKYIRTYYARMYEAKFISGMIAGAMVENDKIAYIADYPIYGMIANINAFALGAAMVNPRAKIYLEWSTKKGYDRGKFLWENELWYVSDQDMITPKDASRQFGLYRYVDGKPQNLVMPLWNWGMFYEKMIQSILAGSYQSKENAEAKALNYWWGMSAGVIDLIFSQYVPLGIQRLARHVRQDIVSGNMEPFYGEIYAQNGELKNKHNHGMAPEDIMKMDWLVDNVVGEIPLKESLVDAAHSVVQLKGVEDAKDAEE